MWTKFRSARFQSSAGLLFGLISWLLPLGVAFALLAIIFGLVGLSRGLGKDKYSTYASLVAITLGSTTRLAYAFLSNRGILFSVVITLGAIVLTSLIFYKYRSENVRFFSKTLIIILLVVGTMTGTLLTKTTQLKEIKPGSLLLIQGYVENKESKAKVLAIDERNGNRIYSLKIYPQDKPQSITRDGKQIEVSGINHIPFKESMLEKFNPKIIGWEEVKDNELGGYRAWKNDPRAGAW